MTMSRAELEVIYPSHPGCCCSVLISTVDPVGTWADHQIHSPNYSKVLSDYLLAIPDEDISIILLDKGLIHS